EADDAAGLLGAAVRVVHLLAVGVLHRDLAARADADQHVRLRGNRRLRESLGQAYDADARLLHVLLELLEVGRRLEHVAHAVVAAADPGSRRAVLLEPLAVDAAHDGRA